MATKFKFEIESDGLTTEQANAFSQLAKALAASTEEVGKVIKALEPLTPDYSEGVAKDIAEAVENTQKRKRASRAKAEAQPEEPTAEEPTAEEPTAEEPTAEEPTAEAQPEEPTAEEPTAEAQPEETKTSTFTIQDVRERVKEKQVKWRTSIKAELERLGSSSVSLLDPEHFEEFCNFMDGLA